MKQCKARLIGFSETLEHKMITLSEVKASPGVRPHGNSILPSREDELLRELRCPHVEEESSAQLEREVLGGTDGKSNSKYGKR